MGRFTRSVQEEASFDGDKITFTVRRLKNDQMINIPKELFDSGGGGGAILLRAAKTTIGVKEIIKDCVTNFSGLKAADGTDIPLSEVLEESYFLSLVDHMLSRILKLSVMSDVDAKKSDATPPDALSEGNAEMAKSQA